MSSVVNMATCPPRSSGSLSCNATTITAVISAMTFSASGAAPTPLYQEYQSHFGLTPFMVTVIFAAYVLCLLLALLTVGSLSDYIGRRPAILSALAMNVVAMLIFMTAGSLERWSSRARCRALRPDSRQRPSGPRSWTPTASVRRCSTA